MLAGLAAVFLLALAPRAGAHEEHALQAEPAVERLYELPQPGSYELPAIDRVDEHWLLAPDGSRAPLLALEPGEFAVVSFMYRSCSDAKGCPLALATLQRLDRTLAARVDLRGKVRLVCASFDPARDTPERMGELRDLLRPRGEWAFLTAADVASLDPILADYGQDVTPLDAGEILLGHVLKVFLIDADQNVRNVYSIGFLDADLLLNDLLTLAGESAGPSAD